MKIEQTPPPINTPLRKKEGSPPAEEIPRDRFEKTPGEAPSLGAEKSPVAVERTNPRDYIESLRHSIKAEHVRKGWKPGDSLPTEGTKKNFWRWDFEAMPPGFKRIDATCRALGKNSYIFIDDASWGTKVNEGSIARLQQVFEKSTPEGSLDQKKGIYDIEATLFGNPCALCRQPLFTPHMDIL